MAYGKIKEITHDPNNGSSSGYLADLTSGTVFKFENQEGLTDVDNKDVVDYTDAGNGIASGILPNLSVRLHNLATATKDVKDAVDALLKAMAKDKNMTDVVVRKV